MDNSGEGDATTSSLEVLVKKAHFWRSTLSLTSTGALNRHSRALEFIAYFSEWRHGKILLGTCKCWFLLDTTSRRPTSCAQCCADHEREDPIDDINADMCDTHSDDTIASALVLPEIAPRFCSTTTLRFSRPVDHYAHDISHSCLTHIHTFPSLILISSSLYPWSAFLFCSGD